MSKTRDKENIIVICLIVVVSIILCFNFMKYHTVPDTYDILAREEKESLTFFKNGRILTGAFIYFGCSLNIPVSILTSVSGILAVAFQICAVYIIYKVISKEEKDNIKKILLLAGSFLTIFNPLGMEHLAYVESGIICLGKLLCVISAKKLIVDNKKILPFILIIIAGICYQGILNIFVVTSVLFMLLQKGKSKKEILKQLLSIGIICGICLIFIIVLIKVINSELGTIDQRIGTIDVKKNYIEMLFILAIRSITLTWNLFSSAFIPYTIIATIILISVLNNKKMILKYVCIVIVAILASVAPTLLQSSPALGARIITPEGALIGISIIFLVKSISKDEKKYERILISIFTLIIFGINSFFYINNGIMINKSNKLEQKYLNDIATEIKEYERVENKKITKIAFYYTSKNNNTFCEFPNNSFTIKALYTSYARLECIEYILKRELEEVPINQKYKEYFKTKNWNDFSKEQLIFEDDTLNLCIF